MNFRKYSVVIIGSGIAGLYLALKLSQCEKIGKILIVTKSKLGESNSRYAQGGIVGVMKENLGDSIEAHISDTIKAGAGLSEFDTVKFVSENSEAIIKDLLSFGVNFDRDDDNNFAFTLEAAHSVRRVLHSGGDATGRKIEEALCKKIQSNEKIDVLEQTIAVEILLNEEKECGGIVVFDNETNEHTGIYSNAVILASGGIGQLYKNTTNPKVATGDGIALAYKSGAVLQDLEFVQFHPTALAVDSQDTNFLISEAVRGEGAKLVDKNGHEFMQKYDERKELAPRDIVTRAIFNEMSEKNTDKVYLKTDNIPATTLLKRFPTISEVCLKNGIDITKDLIPVHPAAHYFMGGIKININAQTSVKNLFAIGEVSSTGLHGANRLASNSLLECAVFAFKLSQYLCENIVKEIKEYDFSKNILKYSQKSEPIAEDVDALKLELQEIMWENVGIIRNEESLVKANDLLQKLKVKFEKNEKFISKSEYEFRNMLVVAQLIIISALNRKESRGAHFRDDFPESLQVAEHNHIIKTKGEPVFVR